MTVRRASVIPKTLRAENGEVTRFCVQRVDRGGLIVARTKTEAEACGLARLLNEAGSNEDAADVTRRWHDGLLEPFCACGRVVSECDGSRRGCRR